MKRLLYLGILIYLICISFSFNRIIITDESEFIRAGKAVANIGIPVYKNDEISPLTVGLWHPPLYVSLLGLSFNLFNQEPQSAHIIGIICFFLNVILIYFICKELFEDKRKRAIIASLAIFLYSTSPFIIKGSLLIDIDNTILAPLMMFFVFIFIRLEKQKAGLDGDILLGLVFGGILWAKFHSLFVIPAIFLYQLINKQYKKAFIQGLIVIVVGFGFFLVGWWIYCQVSNLPFSHPFNHNFGIISHQATSSSNLIFKILFMLGMTRNIILWTSPFLFLLLIIVGIKGIKGYFKTQEISRVDFLFLYSILIIIGYILLGVGTAGFPRYYSPMMPALSIAIASFVSQYLPDISKKTALIAGAILIGGVAFCFFVVTDPLLLPFAPKKILLTSPEAVQTLMIKSLTPVLFYLLLLCIISGVIKAIKQGMDFLSVLVLATFLALVSSNISLDIIQSKAKYSTIYNYGEKGTSKTIEYLKSSVKKEDILICPKDIAYYVKTRFFCNMEPCAWTKDRLRDTIQERDIKYIVFRKNFYYQVNYDPRTILTPIYEKVKDFEDFEVYQKIKQ